MLRTCAPFFLQVAINYPQICSQDFNISLYNTVYGGDFSLRQFVFFDTISALAFGTTPLINYDTALGPTHSEGDRFALEWIYGCPSYIIMLVAKINAYRAFGWAEHSNTNEEWRDIEKMLREWSPDIGPVDESPNVVGRLAIHECWRHAALIYLYMVASFPLFHLGPHPLICLIGNVCNKFCRLTSSIVREANYSIDKHD